jgi:hypothetical protein
VIADEGCLGALPGPRRNVAYGAALSVVGRVLGRYSLVTHAAAPPLVRLRYLVLALWVAVAILAFALIFASHNHSGM